jgi:hypothetical protein
LFLRYLVLLYGSTLARTRRSPQSFETEQQMMQMLQSALVMVTAEEEEENAARRVSTQQGPQHRFQQHKEVKYQC